VSQTNFRVPQPNTGVLMGGDVTKPEFAEIARIYSDLGFKLYCQSAEVEQFLNGLPHVSCKRIFFPLKDKRKLKEVFDEYEINITINVRGCVRIRAQDDG